jgi:hypothetical protein
VKQNALKSKRLSFAVVGRMVASNFSTSLVMPPRPLGTAAKRSEIAQRSGYLRFDLVHRRRARGVDGDAPRLNGLRDLAHQVYDQEAVLEAGALDFDVVDERELPL